MNKNVITCFLYRNLNHLRFKIKCKLNFYTNLFQVLSEGCIFIRINPPPFPIIWGKNEKLVLYPFPYARNKTFKNARKYLYVIGKNEFKKRGWGEKWFFSIKYTLQFCRMNCDRKQNVFIHSINFNPYYIPVRV